MVCFVLLGLVLVGNTVGGIRRQWDIELNRAFGIILGVTLWRDPCRCKPVQVHVCFCWFLVSWGCFKFDLELSDSSADYEHVQMPKGWWVDTLLRTCRILRRLGQPPSRPPVLLATAPAAAPPPKSWAWSLLRLFWYGRSSLSNLAGLSLVAYSR